MKKIAVLFAALVMALSFMTPANAGLTGTATLGTWNAEYSPSGATHDIYLHWNNAFDDHMNGDLKMNVETATFLETGRCVQVAFDWDSAPWYGHEDMRIVRNCQPGSIRSIPATWYDRTGEQLSNGSWVPRVVAGRMMIAMYNQNTGNLYDKVCWFVRGHNEIVRDNEACNNWNPDGNGKITARTVWWRQRDGDTGVSGDAPPNYVFDADY